MEQNEKLSVFKNRIIGDILSLEKQVKREQEEDDKLTRELDHYSMVIEQTESDLKKAQHESLLLENQLKSLRGTLDKQNKKKFELEDQILELLQDQITTDKAGEYRGKLLRETQSKRRDLEIGMSKTENELSIVLLDLEKWRGIIDKSKENVAQVKKNHDEVDVKFTRLTEEINGAKSLVNSKLRALDGLNRQLDQLIEQSGGKEMNPDEVKISEYEKNIEELDASIKEGQAFWLRLQSNVVNLSQKRVQQLNEINYSRKKLLLVEQKAIKVEAHLEAVVSEHREIVRSLGSLNTKLDSISIKLHKTREMHEKDEMECEITHQEATNRLKDAEMVVLGLEQDLDDLGRDIEECKNEALDKHREALAWETKYKMAQEAKKYRDEEMAQSSEIGMMKAEIHRMQVRLDQLRKMQEKYAKDLENTVHHREHIFDSVNAREKVFGGKLKTRSTMQHKINEMKVKLKHVFSEISDAEKNLIEIDTAQKLLHAELENRKQQIEDEKKQNSLIKAEIGQGMILKQENLDYIVRHQYRARRYKILANATQLPKLRNEILIQSDLQHQREINENLIAIAENLIQDFPQNRNPINRILQVLK